MSVFMDLDYTFVHTQVILEPRLAGFMFTCIHTCAVGRLTLRCIKVEQLLPQLV